MNELGGASPQLSILLWAVTLAIGLLIGVGIYTFVYARGGSYLTDRPDACINCHVMREQYAGWIKGSHRSVAVCNDCHTPDGLIDKYAAKAMYGFLHAYAFTTGRFPDEIQITPHMHALTERSCLKCHAPIVEAMTVTGAPHNTPTCLRCHSDVGHQ
ncbi:MAG TPA: cytochrome c nitrite reductase small subunit [Nitrospira sp.]|nr:cytochrome c nitrite reductase small subunit [Nitrospira sp.]